jgi:hypothetical protein
MWYAAQARAKDKQVSFTIAVEDIVIPPVCPVLGIPLVLDAARGNDNSPSLDRVFLTRGYEPGNVAVISARANAIKNAGTIAEHEAVVRWMRSISPPG